MIRLATKRHQHLRSLLLGLSFAGAIVSAPVLAHHSPFVHYEGRQISEVEGVVIKFEWRNPHTRFDVKAVDAAGKETIWNMEYTPPVILTRQGVTKDMFKVGSKLKFAGFKAAATNTMFVTNILFPDGTENYNDTYAPPRWTKDKSKKIGEALVSYQDRKIQGGADARVDGIFRVWANDFNERTPNKLFASATAYQLTDYAKQVKANWDSVKDNPYIFCKNGMPGIMDQVHPMKFSKKGGDIELQIEEYDVVRTIHMTARPAPAKRSPYGHSVGHWEGDTLVIKTTHIDFPWFDKSGTPQSDALQLDEKFTLSEDMNHLLYTVTATDPKVFGAPVVMKREWLWVPGEIIKPYNCRFNEADLGAAGPRRATPPAK